MKIVKIASTIIVGAIVSIASNSAMAASARSGFVCPKTIEGTTPDKRGEIRAPLPSGNALDNPAQLRIGIDELKLLGLSNTLIIDHLIGAYCPTVAQNTSLSDAQKATQVRQFAGRITAIVYSEEDVSDIVLNVLLSPSIVDRVNLKAQASGLSVEGWLSKTIETAVQER